MSRGKELREKFQKKALEAEKERNSPLGRFSSNTISYIYDNFGIWAQNQQFVEKLFAKYQKAGSPQIEQWLKDNLADYFRCDSEPPKWVSEPNWCFYNGEPMVFINQFDTSQGQTFFVFKGLFETEYGPAPLYKILIQDKEGEMVLKGEIFSVI